MLEWTGAGAGARLKMLVLLHARSPPALHDEAKKDGLTVISMKNDWKRVFPFEQ
ncbi:hypothetical protein [Bradyrhizobium cenepequi]|jgi:hypothetical protein